MCVGLETMCWRQRGTRWVRNHTPRANGARRTFSNIAFLPRASSVPSSTRSSTKWATTLSLPSEVTITSRSAPASAASSATSSMPGVSTTGNNSLGTVLVAGRKRVPSPAGGTIPVRGIGTWGVIAHTLSAT